jgi:putative mRNA 3-end processing factor
LQAIEATGATRAFVTHGGVAPLVRYLGENGLDARAVAVEYGDEALEDDPPSAGQDCAGEAP